MNSRDHRVAGRTSVAVAAVVALCAALLVALGASAPAYAATSAPDHVLVLTGENEPESVGCSTPEDCLVAGTNYVRVTGSLTDDQGTIVAVTDGVAGTAQHYPVNNLSGALALNGATCVSWSNCLAVGQGGVGDAVVQVNDGVGGGLQQVTVPERANLYRVACSTATSCVAVGTDGSILVPGFGVVQQINDGVAATPAAEVDGTSFLYGVSCYSASDCVAVGQVVLTSGVEAVVVPIVNGVADLTHAYDMPGLGSLNDVSCGADGICYAVGVNGSGGVVVPMLDGVASAPEQVTGVGLVTISCSSAQRCLAVGLHAQSTEATLVPVIDGTTGTAVLDPDVKIGPASPFLWGDVDCPTATACDLVGEASTSTSEDEIGVLDQLTVPGPVIGPGADRGDGQATVAFGPPADDGGTTVADYTVTAIDQTNPANGGQVTHGTSSPITVSGLTNGDRYTFAVAATNVIGTGPVSTTPPITPATVPGAPTGVSAVAGNDTAVVSFTPPASDGGNPIGGYQVQATDITDANRGGQLAHGTGSPITISGLTGGDTYTFTVTAGNQVGDGPASAPSNQVVPMTVPDPPTAVTAVAGNESAVVSFTPPPSNGGSPITSYTVTAHDQTTAGNGGQTVTGTGSPISIDGLTNGDSYTFTAVATNAVGNSSPSAPSALVIPAGVPTTTTLSIDPDPSLAGQPVTLAATVSPAAATGVVRFTDANGNPLSGCGLVEVTAGAAACSYTFPAVGPYPVTATYYGNDTYAGSSDTLTEQVAAVPGAPTQASATAGPGSAVVSFTAPASDGGSPITGFTVTATDLTNPANGGQWATGAAGPITVNGLTNGDIYTFTVTATNAVGTGPASTASAAVTPTASTPVTTIAVRLTDSTGGPLAAGTASYYADGWHTIGTTAVDGVAYAKLPPGSYSFAMTYQGTRQQLNAQSVTGSSSTVTFTTSDVTVHLTDSTGTPLAGGTASYYADGWHAIGTTTNGTITAQMLPGSYSFAMTYHGTRQQLNAQTVGASASAVTFTTSDVTVHLADSTGTPLAGGTASYYADGWHTIGTTTNGTITAQMLPGSYSFAMTYQGTRQQLNAQTVGASASTVTFTTGQVHSDTGTATGYYAGAWLPFSQGVQLLAGTYTFAFSDGTPDTAITITGGAVNSIH